MATRAGHSRQVRKGSENARAVLDLLDRERRTGYGRLPPRPDPKTAPSPPAVTPASG
jgi:hypothetical protein